MNSHIVDSVGEIKVEWIVENTKFEAAIHEWQKAAYLAIDTEFERRTTYFPKFALLQVFDGKTISIVDPLKVEVTAAFRALLADPEIPKILHSSKEDLEVFYDSWRCEIAGLFDTQVAYGFLTGETSVGYANLVEKVCQKRVAKSATQSDWMKRPLSDEQIQYAAEDVLYLPKLYLFLSEALTGHPAENLFQSDCEEMAALVKLQPDFDNDYRSAKEVYRLDETQLSLFKLLYQWREEVAVTQNRTRNHIAKDVVLVKIAMAKPRSLNYLRQLDGMHPSAVRRHGQEIIKLIEDWTSDKSPQLKPVLNPRDVSGLKGLNELFLMSANKVAQENRISIAILASKRLIRKIAYAYMTEEHFPEVWNGWRGRLLKPHFDQVFSQFNATN
ncbi:hypothetical protein FLL45_03315 [Aliikangiella marina]|uniref:HRDC domain-containing protein n=1 Tax=Aliikangiella marina TaxID=1712262 RepID=A0A545TIJ5_9GAMM|nr:HRDC domain-containing protein [Aliikangiella marina]TQV76996.1 hypothetical protein FLL45_03315 [Aliikangiella marina]